MTRSVGLTGPQSPAMRHMTCSILALACRTSLRMEGMNHDNSHEQDH